MTSEVRPAAHDGWPSRAEPVWWIVVRALDLAIRLFGTAQVSGAEKIPDGGAVLVANHVSWLDPVVLLVAIHRHTGRRLRIVTLDSLFKAPVVGWFLKAGRHIPASTGPAARTTLRCATEALQAGELVLVYPEGGIPAPGQVLAAQPGVGMLAHRADVPVIPIASVGLERRAHWWLGRRRARLAIGDPVRPPVGAARRQRHVLLSQAALSEVRRLRADLERTAPGTAASADSRTSRPFSL